MSLGKCLYERSVFMENFFKRLIVFLSFSLALAVLLLIIATPIYIFSDRKIDLFSANQIIKNIENLEINLTSTIYVKNSNGKWEEYQRLHGTENRIWVSIDNAPQHLVDAFIAIEDERFLTHSGVDWKRTGGAIGNQIFKYSATDFGGSTITQQLIKNITLDNSRTATRKMREIFRAIVIESKLSKKQILEAYLNTISLGNGICGVQVASNYYFNKEIDELSLAECATLAAITKNPSKYNPVTGAEENILRRNVVLDKMLELGKITEQEYEQAYNEKLVLDDTQEDDYEIEINSYFVDTLIQQVINDLAEKYQCSTDIASTMFYNGGYKIYATVNSEIQTTMEDIYGEIDKYFNQTVTEKNGTKSTVQSAMTITDYNGHIVGIVGGVGEKTVNRGLNRAYNSPRQPGSTMKPIGVYALAIEEDIVNYTSKVVDKPIDNYYSDGKKGPKEWFGYYKGNVQLDYAIRKSMNAVPVRLLQKVGIEASYDFLVNKLRLQHLTDSDKNLASLALGGCRYGITTTESAAAYAIFGNNGVYHSPTTYYKVLGPTGETVLEYDNDGEQVISASTATIMNHLLQGVVYGSEGTGSSIRGYSSMKVYAKTGTSSESNDLWLVAGTPYYVGSVWYGFDNPSPIKSQGAANTVWKAVMKEIHSELEKKEFKDSDDVFKKGIGYYKKGTNVDNIINSEKTNSNSSSETLSQNSLSSELISSSSSTSTQTSSNTSSVNSEIDISGEVSSKVSSQSGNDVSSNIDSSHTDNHDIADEDNNSDEISSVNN